MKGITASVAKSRADGHGRKPSRSKLYYCDREGNVFLLTESMIQSEVRAKPLSIVVNK